jgi:hypothetical protein
MTRLKGAVLGAFCLGSAALFSSCSSTPAGPKFGTPEWYWSGARDQFAAGDFAKAQEHLEKLLATNNPFKERAAVWHLVVLGGMAEGYRDLSEAYTDGEKASKDQGREFRRVAVDMQRSLRQYTIGLAEDAGRFSKEMSSAPQFAMDFMFPNGTAAEVATLERVRKGIFPAEPDRLSAQRQALARGMVLTTAAMAGAGKDPGKAAEMFKAPPVQVPRAIFLMALAQNLLEESAIFDRKKLNDPDKNKVMLQLAAGCLKSAADGGDAATQKQAKDVQAKIEKEQKAVDKKG